MNVTRKTIQQNDGPPNALRLISPAAGRNAISNVLVLAVSMGSVVALSGCGNSQDDIRRYAIRRSADVEVAAAPPSRPKPRPAQAAAPSSNIDEATVAAPARTSSDAKPVELPASGEADSGEPLADTESPPATPLSSRQRGERTIANLTRIGEALEQHMSAKGHYPSRAIPPRAQDGGLSWRVALLPYLGYERLYSKFRLDQPWNSRHNMKLLASIPAVYQSPERFDDHTNYVVPVASGTIHSRNQVPVLSSFEDGLENTVLVVEVDDELAVPWTAPRELKLDLRDPARGLGGLRDGSVYVVWGGGQVGRVQTSASPRDLKAMFTHDGGESFAAGRLDLPLFPPAPRVAAVAGSTVGIGASTVGGAATIAEDDAGVLAAEYFDRATSALSDGRERDALVWFYAGVIVGPPGGDWVQHYRWVPALRRPTPALRVAVGLDYSGTREREFEPKNTKRNGPAQSHDRAWSAVAGDFGDQLVETLRRHLATNCEQSLLASQDTSPAKRQRTAGRHTLLADDRPTTLAPGVVFLATGRASVLRRAAQVEGADLLLVVDWREPQHGWSVGLELIDVARGAVALKIPRVSGSAVDSARSNPLASNPLLAVLQQLSLFLEQQCAFGDLPAQLKPHHAQQRVAVLAELDEEQPLRSLAEMRFYRELGLVDAPQLFKAYQSKLGDEAGIELMLGDDTAKEKALAPWLPAVTAPESLSLSTSRHSDDDD